MRSTRIFNQCHHGRISPFAPLWGPELTFVASEENLNSKRNTLFTDEWLRCRKSRQSIYSTDTQCNPTTEIFTRHYGAPFTR